MEKFAASEFEDICARGKGQRFCFTVVVSAHAAFLYYIEGEVEGFYW